MRRIHGDAPLKKEGHTKANEASFGCKEQRITKERDSAIFTAAAHKPQGPLSTYIKMLQLIFFKRTNTVLTCIYE